LTWLSDELYEKVRAALRQGAGSWDELFAGGDAPRVAAAPAGVAGSDWPRLAAHVARVERVREAIARGGREAATRRFGSSPHAAERAALLEDSEPDVALVAGVLDCAIDEHLAYGELLSRLVTLAAADPDRAAAAFERFIAAASAVTTAAASWGERLRVARDGLAALYVRAGRLADAEALYAARFAEETDATVAISAARALLEAGETARAVAWLERAATRAREVGREALERQLVAKAAALRGRLN
jgi:hypothetical protein